VSTFTPNTSTTIRQRAYKQRNLIVVPALQEINPAVEWNDDELLRELVALSRTLTDEQRRNVHENLTEEELTVFGI
jgi:type IV secretory pathway VirD2 relaxase